MSQTMLARVSTGFRHIGYCLLSHMTNYKTVQLPILVQTRDSLKVLMVLPFMQHEGNALQLSITLLQKHTF